MLTFQLKNNGTCSSGEIMKTSMNRSSNGNNTMRAANKTIQRGRKPVPEKWIIGIVVLVTSIFFDSAYCDVMCYECAWQGSTPLPSTADGVSDVCRPHNFNVHVVHKIKCANGCLKQVLYEFGENDPPGARSGQNSNINSSNSNATTNRSRTLNTDNMTFYVRGCQKNKKTRETCENKSFHDQVYAEECVCLSDYCNGEKSGATSTRPFFKFTPNHGSNQPLHLTIFQNIDLIACILILSVTTNKILTLFSQ
ncbi:unnamed protein product [Orchesella dallaii]|uniref:Protein sleepless n=1 Tax=Orchesella dallaii TaxID=48710 RepID=A0ABP1R668_9HEXA